MGKRWLWAMVAVVFLAFVARLLFIDKQSLRGDEGLSVIYAGSSLPEIIRVTRFVSGHPPLFYSTLHFWQALAGDSELSVRFFALWWSVLAVALVFAMGRMLFGPGAGFWAALLTAINSFYIMHAQDIRVYSMLVAASVLSCILFWRALSFGRRRDWVRYALSGLFLTYAHYFGAFVIAAHAALFVWVQVEQRGRWLPGLVSFGGIGAGLAPWLWLARTVVTGNHGPGAQALGLLGMFRQCALTFGVGYWMESWGHMGLSVAMILLLAWGVRQAWRYSQRGMGLVGLVIATPLLMLYVVSFSRPIFRDRYLAFSAPAYHLLWGTGLAGLLVRPQKSVRRAIFGIALVFLLATSGYALVRYYSAPAYFKSPDWRGALSFVNEHVMAGDAVISNHHDQAVLYYYAGSDLYVLPSGERPDAEFTVGELENLRADHDRIWLLPDRARLWDREGLVEHWLGENTEPVLEASWRDVSVLLYHTPRLNTQEMTQLDARVGKDIALLGYIVRNSQGQAVECLEVHPGEVVRLTVYWQTDAPLDEDYIVFVHLLDPTGWLRGQQDNQPRQGTFPTRAWTRGDLVVDRYQVVLAGDAPAGEYTIEIGMYRPTDGARLATSGADADMENSRVLLRGHVVVR